VAQVVERVAALGVGGERRDLAVDAEGADPELVGALDGMRQGDGVWRRRRRRGSPRRATGASDPTLAVGRRAKADRGVEELAAEAEADGGHARGADGLSTRDRERQ
jgi:hypothetical protein